MDDVDANQLVLAWRAGDKKAGEKLYQRNIERLYRFFRTKISDFSAIEDLVHETFLVLLKDQNFRGGSAVSTYLFGVARFKLYEYYRAKKRSEKLEKQIADLSVAELSQHSPFSVINGKRELRALLEALRRLSVDRQIMMELYYWEGFTSAEIGAVIGIPDTTVRSRLGRTKKKLARDVAKLMGLDLKTTESSLDSWARSIGDVVARSANDANDDDDKDS